MLSFKVSTPSVSSPPLEPAASAHQGIFPVRDVSGVQLIPTSTIMATFLCLCLVLHVPVGCCLTTVHRFQQCWLKFDFPLNSSTSGRAKFPRAKNLVDQRTGWMSGVIVENFTDSAPFPERSWSCGCSSNYTYGSYRFEVGVLG